MEVTQQLHNSEFEGYVGFKNLLKKVRFSLHEYFDLYELVYNIAYPMKSKKISSQISPNIQAIAFQIPSGLSSITYLEFLSAINQAVVDHPNFHSNPDDIPF